MYKLLIVFVVVPFLTTTFGLIRADVDTSHIVTPTIIVPTETPAPIISVSDDCETVTLISKSVSIGTYVPTDLVSLTSLGYSNRYVRACVYDPLVTMMNDSQALGLHVTILSAYRSFATQTDIFNQYAQTYGVARANTFSAKPGHSEHQLGTVLDFGNKVRSGLSQKPICMDLPKVIRITKQKLLDIYMSRGTTDTLVFHSQRIYGNMMLSLKNYSCEQKRRINCVTVRLRIVTIALNEKYFSCLVIFVC